MAMTAERIEESPHYWVGWWRSAAEINLQLAEEALAMLEGCTDNSDALNILRGRVQTARQRYTQDYREAVRRW